MKPLVIYHDNCADGFGAAFAAWLKFGDEAEYFACQYGIVKSTEDVNNLPEIGNREVYILDFSLPKEVMDWLFKVSNKVVWLDHHKTAFEMWCGKYYPGMFWVNYEDVPDNAIIMLNDNKSGAMIAWEYFHPDKEIPMLIRHIDDYDRWQFKIEGTKAFMRALWSYAPWSFEQWNTMFYDPYSGAKEYCDMGREQLISEGSAILRAHDQNVQAVVNGGSRSCKISKHLISMEAGFEVGLAANCPQHLASDVGHQLATQSGTYGLLWFLNKEGKCLCSLRSNGDYDVSSIAKSFGGGGHKNAAGFQVDIQTLLGWIK